MKTLYGFLFLLMVAVHGFAQAQPKAQAADQIMLLDVQGLWGGVDVWISTNGNAVCRFVQRPKKGESGLQESRYEFVLSTEQRTSLLELITKNDFFSIQTKDRPGIPDESRPCIFVKSGDKIHAVGKWGNDKHKDFDPLYEFLVKIAESGKKGTQIKKGTCDMDWRPEGFPENKTIWKMTQLKPDKK